MSTQFEPKLESKPSINDLMMSEGYFAVGIKDSGNLIETKDIYKSNMRVIRSNCKLIEDGDEVLLNGGVHPIGIDCKEYRVAILHETSVCAVVRRKAVAQA